MIVDRVLQYALKQHRQLGYRLAGVFLGEFQHRVLNDVEGGILIADGKHRLLEGAALDFGQKRRDFLMRSQLRLDKRRYSVNYKHKPPGDACPPRCVLQQTLTEAARDATVQASAVITLAEALQHRSFAFHPPAPQVPVENPGERGWP